MFNSDQRISKTTVGEASSPTGAIKENIKIAGLTSTTGTAVTLTMSGAKKASEDLRAAMNAAGLGSMSFKVNVTNDGAANAFELVGVDDKGGEYKLTADGWNGTRRDLPDALGTVTARNGGDQAVATALSAMKFISDGDINPVKSVDPAALAFTTQGAPTPISLTGLNWRGTQMPRGFSFSRTKLSLRSA